MRFCYNCAKSRYFQGGGVIISVELRVQSVKLRVAPTLSHFRSPTINSLLITRRARPLWSPRKTSARSSRLHRGVCAALSQYVLRRLRLLYCRFLHRLMLDGARRRSPFSATRLLMRGISAAPRTIGTFLNATWGLFRSSMARTAISGRT